jgi:hypothetical protein
MRRPSLFFNAESLPLLWVLATTKELILLQEQFYNTFTVKGTHREAYLFVNLSPEDPYEVEISMASLAFLQKGRKANL